MMRYLTVSAMIFMMAGSISVQAFNCDSLLDICVEKAMRTACYADAASGCPRSIQKGESEWSMASFTDWTAGFYPGILWYAYEYSDNPEMRKYAEAFTESLMPYLANIGNHDLGIMTVASAGHAWRLAGEEKYRKAILDAAENLSLLYNPAVGTINSWPYMKDDMGWPHNTIIDNMINIELLFLASEISGDDRYCRMAVNHAETTMKNHFRKDGSTYHVLVYDDKTGEVIKKITHQGYSDDSMWARGQAWAIYGFSMAYKKSGDKRFLRTAVKAADVFWEKIPDDFVPCWDFDDPEIPDAPKDASAAAIAAAGMIEIAALTNKPEQGRRYLRQAVKILESLSSPEYSGGDASDALILHCTGHKPHGYEIDSSIIYGDYYYVEALMRLRNILTNHSFNN